MFETKQIAKTQTIGEIVANRDRIAKLTGEAQKLKSEIERLLTENNIYSYSILKNWPDVGDTTLDREFWKSVATRFLKPTMSAAAKRDLDYRLEKTTDPFTLDNVMGLAKNIEHIYLDNFRQLIIETYKAFTGCSYGNWRNKKIDNVNEVKPKFRKYAYFTRFSSRENEYHDFYKVFQMLDTESGGRFDPNDCFEVYVRKAEKSVPYGHHIPEIDTPYFHLKLYKNGNALVTVKRLDLLKEFNYLGGHDGKKMPSPNSKHYKPEHFGE